MPTDNESGRPRRAARAAKIVIGSAAALVVLPIAALAIVAWTVDLGGLVRGRLDEIERTYLTGGALGAAPTEEHASDASG